MVGQNIRSHAARPGNTFGDGKSAVEQEPSDLADDGGAVIDHPLPGAMQGLDILVFDGLQWNEGNMG